MINLAENLVREKFVELNSHVNMIFMEHKYYIYLILQESSNSDVEAFKLRLKVYQCRCFLAMRNPKSCERELEHFVRNSEKVRGFDEVTNLIRFGFKNSFYFRYL